MGLVKKDGYEVFFPKYESVEDLGNGYIIVGNNGKFGLINEKGIYTIPMQYQKLEYDASSDLYFGLKAANWENITITK